MVKSLDALLERVRNATGPDRELDFLIQIHVARPLTGDESYTLQDVMDDFALLGPEGMTIDAPYTASVDAALALADRLLPGRAVAMGLSSNPSPYCAIAPSTLVNAATLPLAILAALLTALSNRGEHHD